MKIICEKLIHDITEAATEASLGICISKMLSILDELDQNRINALFDALRERVVFFVIQKGLLPPFTLLELFFVFSQHIKSIDNNPLIENQLNVLKMHLTSIEKSSYEYFLINDLIFLLEIFQGECNSGFRNYLTYIMKSDIFEAYKYPEAFEQFNSILKNSKIPAEEMVEYISSMLDAEYFFNNDAEAQSSILIWIMTVIWAEKRFVGSPAFYTLEGLFENIMLKALELNNLALAIKIYKVAHDILSNLFHTQEEMAAFNHTFTAPINMYYSHFKESLIVSEAIEKKKKKIAFVRDRLVNNSPHMIEYSVIKVLMENENFTKNFEVYLYSTGRIEKDLDDEKIIAAYQKLGVIVKTIPKEWYVRGYYYDPLEKAMMLRNDMVHEHIDIMIGTVASNSDVDFLFTTRTAPHQIYWSHGNFEYDVPNIDRRITHGTVPSGKFSYSHFSVQRDYSDYKSQSVIAQAESIRSQYGKDTVILGSIGRLVKVDSLEYLEAVAKLLRMNPNAVYLACGSGNIETIKAKLEGFGVEDRFLFVGFVEAKIYVNVLDIYLDTFPHHGGESVREAQMAGCCVATLHIESEKGSPDMRSLENDALLKQVNYQLEMLDEEWLNNEGFIHQVISFASLNTDAYIGIVDYFVKHPNCRQVVKNVFKTYTPEMVSYKEFLEVIGFE
jgi:tetratricopeptide (TPR) repeat protein